jgi:16S rRNA C967 or C1407 C5-methylase (RsmB/RsmF family)/NOL1/NOP2/fmu family ribosome biogenesis protein
MFPKEFLDRIKLQTYIDVPDLLFALERPGRVSIRLNTAKWSSIPASSSPVPWCRTGFYLETRPSFTADPLFHSGCYYPQEASGMFTGEVFEQVSAGKDNLRVLDLCSAPGGKSTHLSELIGSRGLLVANEVIKPRADILAENLTKWGTSNSIVTRNDPSVLGRLKGYFDIILIDAPCSGEGMFRDQVALKEWSPSNSTMCSSRQKRILMDVWPALKQDGILIYSTCTFNPAENEENIKWLTENTDSENLKINTDSFQGIKEISYMGVTGYGFYPGKIEGEGFFLSAVRKSGNSEIINVNQKKLIKATSSLDIKTAETMTEGIEGNIYRHNDIVYKLSCPVEEFLGLKNWLNIIKGGTALFKTRNGDVSPLHEMAVSCKIRDGAFPVCDLDYRDAIFFLRRENLVMKNQPVGWILVSYLGVNLGFVKNIGTRINNYFPVQWRIRLSDSSLSVAKPVSWE